MSRTYTKVKHLGSEVFRRKTDGKTNQANTDDFGLMAKEIKQLMN